MTCMKCGREIDEGQVFCGDCLLDMEKHPVKPGTAVLLPPRDNSAQQKKQHRRPKPSPEEMLAVYRKRTRVLFVLFLVCVVLLAALAVPAFRYFQEDHVLPGQNYSSMTPTESSTGE